MEHLHIYEIVGDTEGGNFNSTELKHTKVEITKKTAQAYYFDYGGKPKRIARKRLNTVILPEGTRAVLTSPDNELARKLFTEYLNMLIDWRESELRTYRQAKQVVEAFKD
jgi:hypothetical protein